MVTFRDLRVTRRRCQIARSKRCRHAGRPARSVPQPQRDSRGRRCLPQMRGAWTNGFPERHPGRHDPVCQPLHARDPASSPYSAICASALQINAKRMRLSGRPHLLLSRHGRPLRQKRSVNLATDISTNLVLRPWAGDGDECMVARAIAASHLICSIDAVISLAPTRIKAHSLDKCPAIGSGPYHTWCEKYR